MVAVNNLDQREDLDPELYKDVIGGKEKGD